MRSTVPPLIHRMPKGRNPKGAPPRDPHNSTVFAFRLEKVSRERLAAEAERLGTSSGLLVRSLVVQYLKDVNTQSTG